MEPRVPVTFAPSGVTAWVKPGATILEAARSAGIVIPAPCGGRGACGKCAVRILEGQPERADELEKAGLARAPAGLRLACRAKVTGPVTVRPVVAGGVVSQSGASAVTDESFLAGVDLGTTTVSAVIVGAQTGLELGRGTVPNSQQSFGMDVVSRIAAGVGGRGPELQAAAESSVTQALEAACGAAGACLERIVRLVIAGNTAMTALLAGADVSGLSQAPFREPDMPGNAIKLPVLAERLAAGAEVIGFDGLGGFVGGDIPAGLLASGLLASDEDAIFVDIGTNAEIVVRSNGRIAYASAAAGPAFEGYGMSSGGPAGPGAVTRVDLTSDIRLEVIGGGEPLWLAGSGVVSAVAELLRVGHIDRAGGMHAEGPASTRFGRDEAGVVRVGLGPYKGEPYLTQLDVRAFQTAKAAVAAGLVSVVRACGLKPKKVQRFVVAGSFGAALDIVQLVALGVVPSDLADRSESLADAALTGAAELAFDPTAASDVTRLKAVASRVELATDSKFATMFAAATELAPYTLKKGF